MSRVVSCLLCLLLVFSFSVSYADEAKYVVSSIPGQLLKKANAIIRNAHFEVDIVSAHEVRIKESYAVTVLNDKGAAYGKLRKFENAFISVKSIKGRLYDKYGNEVRELKKKEVNITAPYSYGGITDVHYNNFDFGYGGYPYTCEYEIETIQDMTFFLPKWEPQNDYECAIESSDITVRYPQNFPLRYHLFNIPATPVVRQTNGQNVLTASVKDVSATADPDEFAPNSMVRLPTIIFAAQQFELADESGSMATWKELGAFVYKLNEGRDVLPDATKKIVHELTDTCKTTSAKISLLYEYLKKSTRYVSVQLGIGGWQTFDAQYVAQKGYGDCKALSNYMRSLLKEAGVKAYQAIVSAGRGPHMAMIEDFPCAMFNHVILCVPGASDSTWVECTSHSLPAGYLSAFTDNRNVLLLTENGGYVVRTPKNKPDMNSLTRTATLIGSRDQICGNVSMVYKGYLWEKEESINEIAKSDIASYIVSKLKNGDFSVMGGVLLDASNKAFPYLNEQMSIKGDGNITDNGTHVFLSPYIFSNIMAEPHSYELLKGSFELHRSYSVSDTLTYHFTGNYTMDTYERYSENTPFASYNYRATMENDNTVKVIYHYRQNEGIYPLSMYPDYMKLYREINSVCSNKLVLSKKD